MIHKTDTGLWVTHRGRHEKLTAEQRAAIKLIRDVLAVVNRHFYDAGEAGRQRASDDIVAVAVNLVGQIVTCYDTAPLVSLDHFNSLVIDYLKDVQDGNADSIGPTKGEA